MRTFRLLLTLMLCLSVPVAGWASVLSGPLCPQMQTHAEAHAMSATDSDHGDSSGGVVSSHAQHHEECGDMPTHGKPCKGERCACGCGFGACTSSALSILTLLPTSFPILIGKQAVSQTIDRSFAATRDSSPLRPPIS